MNKKVKIIGVTKSAFSYISEECKVFRGESKKPLFITSAGLEQEEAK